MCAQKLIRKCENGPDDYTLINFQFLHARALVGYQSIVCLAAILAENDARLIFIAHFSTFGSFFFLLYCGMMTNWWWDKVL